MFPRLAAAEFFIKFQKIVNWRSKLFVESGYEVLTVVCVAGEGMREKSVNAAWIKSSKPLTLT